MGNEANVQQALSRFLQPQALDAHRQRVCRHLMNCRTAAMGGRQWQCIKCEHEQVQYFSCRDRHCPQCQWRAIQEWSQQQRAHVLPVPYHHLVFTLPHQLNGWVQLHPEVIYRLLFKAVWATLDQFGRDPKRLGGQLGMTSVLHTWGQTLNLHVHLHCLVPAGALSADGQWHAARSTYLFPVRALSRRFRGLMVSALRQAAKQQQLHRVTRPGEGDHLLGALMDTDWVVYSKPCLQHTATVIDYLARYTRRIAISNARVVQVDAREVTLSYKDYRHGTRHRRMTLAGEEFVRRFLLHVLPKGLMRVRHYGFLANRCRRAHLAQIQRRLESPAVPKLDDAQQGSDEPGGYVCQICQQRSMICTSIVAQRQPKPLRQERRC